MKFKRIGRVLVCLLLVSALLINASPIKAKASAVGATAAITAASTVLTPAGLVVGATFVALGLAAAANPEGFQNMVDAGVSALESAGTWVKDGMVDLLRTEDADGNASYYVDSGMMEDVRTWSFESDTIYYNGHRATKTLKSLGTLSYSSALAYASECENCFTFEYGDSRGVCAFEGGSACYQFSNGTLRVYNSYTFVRYWYPDTGVFKDWSYSYDFAKSGSVCITTAEQVSTDSVLTLGIIPSVPVDGTSARQWSEEYTDRGLKVYGGGSGNNNKDGKWFWKVMIPLTALDLLAMSQADQWSGETPKEFEDYTTKEEFEIVSRPEVDFAHGVELAPITSPTPDTGGDTGSDTGSESGNQTDYTNWFERIIKSIEELPSKFESWITDCKSAIEELPSKFAEWFNTISEKLSSIWETLKTIPQTILDGMRNILSELFVPQEDYLTDKLTSLRERFSFADSIIDTGKAIGTALATGEAEPPVIYIHLEDTEGSYNIGGTTPFLDMRWYARFKPVGDKLLSSLIWIFFIWRCFVHAPNIISGIAGDVEALNIPDGGGMYLSGSHSPFEGGPYEKVKRGRFERRTKRRR